jgi:hypothetical protein
MVTPFCLIEDHFTEFRLRDYNRQKSKTRNMLRRSTLFLFFLLLLAALLRFYRLDAQSLWSDEGSSVAQALRDMPTIAEHAARDIHPPFYYILLHVWIIPFGISENGVRSLSAVLGVMLVGLCYWLGKELYDERTAWLAAAIAAINPFQIYYAQEARMYLLLAMVSALTVYATIKSQVPNPQSQRVWYGVYLGAAVMGLYTHYLFPIVLMVTNVIALMYVMVDWLQHADTKISTRTLRDFFRLILTRHFMSWCLLQIIALLAFLPWLPIAIRQLTTWPAGAQTFTASDAPLVILRTLSLGLSATQADAWWLLLFGAWVVLGAFTRPLVHSSTHALIYLLVPIAAMFAFELFKDAFLKFLIVASPPFVLLLAHGISRMADGISRIASCQFAMRHSLCAIRNPQSLIANIQSLILLFLLSIPTINSLHNYYFDPRFARDDYRSIAQFISALARDDDAIILDAPGQQEIFRYYYHGAAPIYGLPNQRPPDATQTENDLANIAAKHARLFAIFWAMDESDPQRLVETWLNARTFKASDSWYGNVRLAVYANPRASQTMQQSLDLRWGERITLLGYTLASHNIRAGEVLPLTLFWRTDQPITTRYKVFAHLLDPRGFVIAQRDAEPVGGSRPTSDWRAGETIADPYGLFIPFGTPPRNYHIEIGLYDLHTGQRLKNTKGEDHLLLNSIRVERAPFTPPITAYHCTPLDIMLASGLRLVGYRVDKLGTEGQSAVSLRAGDALHLTLFWRKSQTTAGNGAYRWQLGALSKQTTPTDGLYPITEWREDEIVRDDQIIVIPNDWQAGIYALEIEGKKIGEMELRN